MVFLRGTRGLRHLHPGAAPLRSSLGAAEVERRGAYPGGACKGSCLHAGQRTAAAGSGSQTHRFTHLSVQLHSPQPAAPTAFAAGHGHFQGQEALATFPAWSLKSSELLRCHLASLTPSLPHSQIKWKQNSTHVSTGLDRGWHAVGETKVVSLPAPSVYPSFEPLVRPATHAGQLGSLQAGSATQSVA